ncbi:MAG: helix-turn-helix domain-containing protein [Candidatus Aenigmatarchaeota archaeon]
MPQEHTEAEDPETGVVRKIVETVDFKTDKLEEIHEKLNSLDERMERMEDKLDKVITEDTSESDLKDVHKRILDLLGGWMSTKNLAKIMNYRQEYVSRKVSELKKMGLVEEKRDGKSILYKRKGGVKEAMEDNE